MNIIKSKCTLEQSDVDRPSAEDEISELLHTDERITSDLISNKEGSTGSEINSSNVTTVSPDGGWGWIIVLGSFFVHLLTDGMLYSFGILYIEFLGYYRGGKGETAWIGSMATGFQLLTGPIASVLTEKFGCRTTTIMGALIVSLGFILSAFSPSLHFLYFSFGTISGLGFGLTYFPAVVSVGHYFEKKRTLALGLASCGSGIGAFILNPLSKYLIDEYGWRGALLFLGGIQLHCMLCGAIFRPLRNERQTGSHITGTGRHNPTGNSKLSILETRKTTSLDSLSDLELSKQNSAKNGIFCAGNRFCKCTSQPENLYPGETAYHFTKNEHSLSQVKDRSLKTYVEKNLSGNKITKDVELSHKGKKNYAANLYNMVSKACNVSQFKDKIFITYLISNVLISASLGIPFKFLYDLATGMGVDVESGKWLGAIIGIANTIGRVFSGILADKLKLNKILLFSTSIMILGISTALCPLCFNFTWFVVFSCVFGLCYGIYIPLMSVVIVDILGKQMLANAFGLLLLLKGFANLIGPPFAGWLYDKTGSYEVPFIVAGFSLTIAGIMLAFAICVKKRQSNKGCDHKEPGESK